MVEGQPIGKKKFMRLHLKGKELYVVVHACHPSYHVKCKIRGSWFRLAWTKSETLSPK
jgi:hypothetical protein